jgi:4-amino-4-deoxy-L-arabinose transferase-like glycosyltransferase
VTVASGVEVAGQRTDATNEVPSYRRAAARVATALRAPGTLAGIALFAVTFGLLIGQPVGHADEAWFLWVLSRVSRGQTLYRDVYFVSTPIPAWIGLVAVRLFGTQILVTRALSTLAFTVSTWLGWVVARRCGVGRGGRILLVAAFFVYASPVTNFASFYSSLAVLFALAALVVLLRWIDQRDAPPGHGQRDVLAMGALAGLAFACKPNVGLATVGAIAVIVVAAEVRAGRRAWSRSVGLVIASFVAISAVTVLVVVVTGAWSGFTGDVFTGKAHYLDVFTGGYLPGLRHVERIVPLFGPPAFEYANRLWYSASLVPVVAVLVTVAAFAIRPGPRRLQAGALAAFAAVGAISLIPRGGPQHLTETAPLFLTVIAGAAGLLPSTRRASRLGRVLAVVLAAWLAIATGALVVRAVEPFGQRTESVTGLPHVVGAVVADHTIHGVRTVAARARQEHVTNLFIIRPDASYYYLTAQLTNPTPFDFPGISDLGRGDQDGVIRLLRRGTVQWVCVGDPPAPGPGSPTRPLRLEAYVRRAFVYTARLRICDLYRFPVPPARHQ